MLSYCNSDLNVNESVMGFYRNKSTHGKSLYHLFKRVLISFSSKVENLKGQWYAASNDNTEELPIVIQKFAFNIIVTYLKLFLRSKLLLEKPKFGLFQNILGV